MNSTIRKLTLGLALLCSAVAVSAQSNYSVATDSAGFLRTERGQPWTRMVVAVRATDTDFAALEVAIECSRESKQVFIDELRVMLSHKSAATPTADMPTPATMGQIPLSDEDWETWKGSTKITLRVGSTDTEGVNAPIRDVVEIVGGSKQSVVSATAIRLNPLPARPREVTVVTGPSKAIASSASKLLAKSLNVAGPLSSVAINFVSGVGRPVSATFDVALMERNVAVALNRYCGTP